LDAAREVGIAHFDVAPMYGLGLAEQELGEFARGCREKVVIATKFGIVPTPFARRVADVQGPGRRLLSRLPMVQRRARTAAAGPSSGWAGTLLYERPGYDALTARRGLEQSLRALGTDYVDILLLHDPRPGAVRSEELCCYLESARSAGKLRAWGLAGEGGQIAAVCSVLADQPPVVQVRYDPQPRSEPPRGQRAPSRIYFGVAGSTMQEIVGHVGRHPSRAARWAAQVGADCTDPEIVASLLLRCALRDNLNGVTLVTSVRVERLVSAAALAGDARPHEDGSLDAFLALVDSETGLGGNGDR
jgi:D-threo-aldose 1-dehydrogenase